MTTAKVLIIEDMLVTRTILRNILEDNNYEIIGEACNGADGIKKYKALLPDVVTLDILMEEMSGLDVLKEIMKINKCAKVVMMSSVGQEKYVKQALKDGAVNYVVKPLDAKKVLAAIEKIL